MNSLLKKNKLVICIFGFIVFMMLSLFAVGTSLSSKTYGVDISSNGSETTLSQPTFHPSSGQVFGRAMDVTAIKRVDVDDNNKCMSITFDSAYTNDYTYQILDILDKYDAKATFFMTGDFISENPTHVRDIIARGHEIGNHSMTHKDFTKINADTATAEVIKCHEAMKEITGIDMCFFRFPYGAYNSPRLSLVRNLGYYPIQWTYDSIDWKDESVDAILDRFKDQKNYKAGNIILFHNGAAYTPEALPTIIEDIKKAGLKLVRVSDLIYKDNFYLDFEGTQKLKEEE